MKKFLIFFAVVIFLTCYVWYFWHLSVTNVSQKMLSNGELMTIGLDGEMVKQLRAVPEDSETIAFQSIKKRLENFQALNHKVKFIYLYTQKNNQLFFMADSEPSDSPDYSFPGQLYQEAADYYYKPFEIKKGLVTSPVTDRWGTWVTTLTPIINDQNEVIAVLGIDVEARTWFLEIIQLMILPLTIILAIIIILLIYFSPFKKRYQKHETVFKKLFPWLVLIIFLMIILPGFAFWRWEMNSLKEQATFSVENTRTEIDEIIAQQKMGLTLTAKSIANNNQVKENLKELNVEQLLADWQDVFWEMNSVNELTHFYFFDENRICLLRIHNPEKSGDFINRFTAQQAELTRKTSTGLELGPLGTFTLRVVEPIFWQDELIGYLELGKEIEDVLKLAKIQTNNDLILTINKEYLNQETWQKGMLMLKRQADWHRFNDKVIIYNSIEIPDNVWFNLKNNEINIFDDFTWFVSFYPAFDAFGKQVGEITVVNDVTKWCKSLRRITFLGGGISFLFLILLSFIIYSLLRKTDHVISSQKKDLEESFNRFNNLAKQSRTFIWEVDKQGKYVYLSDNVKDVIGYSEKELLGKSVISLHPEQGRDKFERDVFQILNNKEKMTGFENQIIHKNRKAIWVLSSGFPVVDEKNNLIKYRGSDTDITEIKKTENDLIESRSQYQALVSNIPGTTYRCLFDKDWTMIFLTKDIEQLTGYPVNGFINNKFRSYESVIHPEDKQHVDQEIKKAIKQNNSWEIEYKILTKDKEIKWVLEKGRAVAEKENKIKFLDGIIFDITDRKKIEIDLALSRQNLEKFKLAVENASDHIVITDKEGICLYANNMVEKITGFSKKEVIGQKAGIKENWGGLMDKGIYDELWKTIKQNKKPFFGELKNKRKNGQEYNAKASIAPVFNEQNQVEFFVGIERDITKEKEIDKAKTEFVSLASHQLRTPLSTINWYAEMLLAGDAGKISQKQEKYLQEIYQGNQRMVQLVNALLNVSRLELGTFTIDPEIIDVVKLTENIIKDLTIKIKEKNHILEERYQKDLPKLKVDEKLLRIVIENLLTNALKYTPEKGKIEIEISTAKKSTKVDNKKIPKDSMIIMVKDNGYGISSNQQDRVFQKLFRADNIIEKETEGTGLGLYIVKSIIDHSDGLIWFKSQENKGTTFFVIIPLKGMKKKKGLKSLG